jgi:hypothetical protein
MLDAFEHKLTGSVFFTHLRLGDLGDCRGLASASMSAKLKRTRDVPVCAQPEKTPRGYEVTGLAAG